jgi:hypothetical protein
MEEEPTDDGGDVVDLNYRTSRLVPRDDLFGTVARSMGHHPIVAGIIGGLVVVAIAALSALEGVATAPIDALILSGIVVTVWAVLFFFMRDFFARQADEEISEAQHIEADAESFVWETNGEAQLELAEPTYRLVQPPGSDLEVTPKTRDRAAEVWLIVEGDEGRFVLETKVTKGEAAGYPALEEEEVEPDQMLPTHLASSLLQRAERTG